jgi:hypothetical protein
MRWVIARRSAYPGSASDLQVALLFRYQACVTQAMRAPTIYYLHKWLVFNQVYYRDASVPLVLIAGAEAVHLWMSFQ